MKRDCTAVSASSDRNGRQLGGWWGIGIFGDVDRGWSEKSFNNHDLKIWFEDIDGWLAYLQSFPNSCNETCYFSINCCAWKEVIGFSK